MESRQIKYFCKVAEYGSISKAAQAMHITQPSMSIAIRKLEEEIGMPLMDHLHGRVQLNRAGELFYRRACLLLSQVTDMRREVAELEAGEFNEIHIAGNVDGLLARPVSLFLSWYPEYRIISFIIPKEEIEQGLLDGRIDFAICTEGILSKQIEWSPIFTDEYVLLVHCEHPLCEKEYDTAQDIENEKILLYSPAYSSLTKEEEVLKNMGIHSRPFVLTNELEMVRNIIQFNGGASVMSKTVCSKITSSITYPGHMPREEKQVYRMIPIRPPVQGMTLGVAKRADHYLTKPVRMLYEYLQNYDYARL